jgi:hypothetical protein
VSSVTTGTNLLLSLPKSSGCSANFNYCVIESGGAMRSGTVKCVWNSTVTGYVDYSTTDIVGSTSGIVFSVIINGSNLELNAIISLGTWNIKASTEIVF